MIVLVLVIVLLASGGGTPPKHGTGGSTAPTAGSADPRLSPTWRGDDKPITLAFGGTMFFQTSLGTRLKDDPATALGPTVHTLLQGADLSMAEFESALTDGTCTTPAPTPSSQIWFAPATAITAFKGAGLDLVAMANQHALDCGQKGLTQTVKEGGAAGFPIIGIGTNAAVAYAPFTTSIDGQHVAVIAATEIFPHGEAATWTATATRPGLASAITDESLLAAVETARRKSDTVVVYMFWGTSTTKAHTPLPQQTSLAQALVRAGADIVVGTGNHVPEGAGYLGHAFIDYGLGNFAFYDTQPPANASGVLLVTMTGRHVDGYSWRPALLKTSIPHVLSGSEATDALSTWTALRAETDLSASPTRPVASGKTETTLPPVPSTTTTAPTTTTTTTTTEATTATSSTSSGTTTGSAGTTTSG